MISNKTILGKMLMDNAMKRKAMKRKAMKLDTPPGETILFYDTETSGFRSRNLPYDDICQAWVMQLAWILTKSGEPISSGNHIIHGEGKAPINHHAEKVHGISLRKTLEEGKPEAHITELFLTDVAKADKICCHNYKFDIEFLKDMIARSISVETAVSFGKTPHLCTMDSSTEFCKLPHGRWKSRYKFPNLTELHQILFEEDFSGAHDAMADVKATARCYFELVKQGVM